MKKLFDSIVKSKTYEVIMAILLVGATLDFVAYPLLTAAFTLYNILGFLVLGGVIVFVAAYVRINFIKHPIDEREIPKMSAKPKNKTKE